VLFITLIQQTVPPIGQSFDRDGDRRTCHRRLTLLDRENVRRGTELSGAKRLTFPNIAASWNISDAVRLGLTAYAALHTAQIFGDPIYTLLTYREARLVDGWLIDIWQLRSIPGRRLAKAGITFDVGEDVK